MIFSRVIGNLIFVPLACSVFSDVNGNRVFFLVTNIQWINKLLGVILHTFSKRFTLTVKHLNKYNHTYPAVPLFLAYNWTKHSNLTWENGNELYNFVFSYAIIGGVLYDCWWCFLLITHLCNTCVTADQCFIIKYLLFIWAEPLVLFGLLKSRKENRIHFLYGNWVFLYHLCTFANP